MLDTLVVTLAVGPKYVELAAKLLHALDRMGNATLVVTDDPRPFPTRTIVIPYVPDGAHIWHAKRHAVRAGLERAQTVYFVDADYQPRELPDLIPPLAPLPLGASSLWEPCPLRTLRLDRAFIDLQILARPAVMLQLQQDFQTPPWREILWWGDHLYAVTRDPEGRWRAFLDAWDRFAGYRAPDPADRNWLFVSGDGLALAFAAASVGWIPLKRTAAFVPIRFAFAHGTVGRDYKLALGQAIPYPVE